MPYAPIELDDNGRRLVEERKKWLKFGGLGGRASLDMEDPNTVHTKEADLFLRGSKRSSEQERIKALASLTEGVIKCSECDGDHYSSNCPTAILRRQKKREEDMEERYMPPSLANGECPNTTVKVSNLHSGIKADDIRKIFSKAGTVINVHMPVDKITGEFKGFAFVTFGGEPQAEKAIKLLNRTPIEYVIISVEMSRRDLNR